MAEVYKLDCESCGRMIELPAGDPREAERLKCPHCGAGLRIEWRPPETRPPDKSRSANSCSMCGGPAWPDRDGMCRPCRELDRAASRWIIQRCTQKWIGNELQYEDWGSPEKPLTYDQMLVALDETQRQFPDHEFRGHRVDVDRSRRVEERSQD